jgi:uncharacterized protein with GYD domain
MGVVLVMILRLLLEVEVIGLVEARTLGTISLDEMSAFGTFFS